MKITIPIKKNKKIVSTGYSNLYAVIAQFSDGKWEFADFWDLPYTTKNYKDSFNLKQRIMEKAGCYEASTKGRKRIWSKNNFSVARIKL